MVKPFRFGVQCGGDRDRASLEQVAHKIEALGYSTFYVPDHFIDTQMAPIVAMAVAAEATKTLRVGALVFDNDYKHPAVLAKEIATLDRLSDGRAELGIGAGWMKVDYDALGIPYDSAGVRVDRLEEALAVIKGSWGPDAYSFTGDHYTITDYNGIPKPAQQPHPPILVGGGGPRVLRLAGREADIVGINPNLRAGAVTNDAATDSVAEMIDQKVGWITRRCGRPLRRPRAADPLLLRGHHRRPPRARGGGRTGLRARAGGRARGRDHLHRDRRRDLRPARHPPGAMGRELHRDRRRHLRGVRARSGEARGDLVPCQATFAPSHAGQCRRSRRPSPQRRTPLRLVGDPCDQRP